MGSSGAENGGQGATGVARERDRESASHEQWLELMNRALVRVSLLADGIDQSLDTELEQLRRLVRRDNLPLHELQQSINTLETRIKAFDDQRDARLGQLREHFQALAQRLDDLAQERSLRSRLRKLSRSVPDRISRQSDLVELAGELADLQAAVLAGLDGNGGVRQGRLLSRWLGRNGRNNGNDADPAAPPATDKRHSRDAPDTAAPVAETAVAEAHPYVDVDAAADEAAAPRPANPVALLPDHDLAGLIADASRIIDALLRQIDPPEDVLEAYQEARRLVLGGLDADGLLVALEASSQVVIAALDGRQMEFQAFLLTLNQRLEDVSGWLDSSRRMAEDRKAAGDTLDHSLRAEVQAMQAQVMEATDLGQLQTTVSARLDSLVGAFDAFRRDETRRESLCWQEVEQLQGRLQTMEQEAHQAEQRLAEQRQLALRDMLTELPNRQAYEERLADEFGRWQRYQRPLTLAILDIDHFKDINDCYGHLAGDRVLKVLARTVRKRLRKSDFLARYGGEEFVLLLPETDVQKARVILESLREAVATCPFHFREQRVEVTCSIGYAGVQAEDTPEALFERADQNLYQAKNSGRNSIRTA